MASKRKSKFIEESVDSNTSFGKQPTTKTKTKKSCRSRVKDINKVIGGRQWPFQLDYTILDVLSTATKKGDFKNLSPKRVDYWILVTQRVNNHIRAHLFVVSHKTCSEVLTRFKSLRRAYRRNDGAWQLGDTLGTLLAKETGIAVRGSLIQTTSQGTGLSSGTVACSSGGNKGVAFNRMMQFGKLPAIKCREYLEGCGEVFVQMVCMMPPNDVKEVVYTLMEEWNMAKRSRNK